MKIKPEFESIFNSSLSSIENTSKDIRNNQTLVNDNTFSVYNFDNIVDLYSKIFIKSSKPRSIDALYYCSKNDLIYLIEFKNSDMSTLTQKCSTCKTTPELKIKSKISDSLIILLDMIDKDISFARKNIICILVVKSLSSMKSILHNKANKQPHMLEMFEKNYLKKTHTMSANEFQNNYMKNNW